jgi:hypothetical protein
MAPLVIGLFFFASLQMVFMGILGEYIGAIHTFVQKRPLVFEKERINFQYGATIPAQDGLPDAALPGVQADHRTAAAVPQADYPVRTC